ncbi:formate dehydrogenase [Oceanobacillus iheyensis HTE831]|uniref:Formate dehydrogenase n=1 Tax=Oceanobacillus iheyensis (strain DSM 14371 / CIP 107618 / JCM 11309 / KCTC 3954 / HTE831) TaxID=221109 RepID=Q8ES73_OCEIH|nr:formate/nitrite transporter family protein [Oceanobacillus iheyensis]BAC12726.1 formate dehydrogenase [Oceanobacillus iheyensis HTE831]
MDDNGNKESTNQTKETKEIPERQFLFPVQVMQSFSNKGKEHLDTNTPSQLVLALKAGSFMTFGAVFSVLLAIGVDAKGLTYILQGIGFTAGYLMVFMSQSVLFTEVNVLLPTYYLQKSYWIKHKFIKFWAVAYIGNLIGALFVALLIIISNSLTPEFSKELETLISHKMKFADYGWAGWFQVLLSGILANWLIGMATFLTTSARDVVGKILGTALPVILFVAGNFQHSAANMGYFSLGILTSDNYAWYEYILLNLIPASIGNIIGGAIFISLLFLYAFRKEMRS